MNARQIAAALTGLAGIDPERYAVGQYYGDLVAPDTRIDDTYVGTDPAYGPPVSEWNTVVDCEAFAKARAYYVRKVCNERKGK